MDIKVDKDMEKQVEELARVQTKGDISKFCNNCIRLQIMPQSVDVLQPWGTPEDE